MSTHINILPNETLIHIFSHINEYELIFIACVCKKWYDCALYLRNKKLLPRWFTPIGQITQSIGHLSFYKEMSFQHDYQFDSHIMNQIVKKNDFTMFNWAIDNKMNISIDHIIKMYIQNDKFDIIKLLFHILNKNITNDHILHAIKWEKYDIMFWLIEHGVLNHCSLEEAHFTQIIINGNIDILKKLNKMNIFNRTNYECNTVCDSAIKFDKYNILKWCHSINMRISPSCVIKAIEKNNFEIFKFLYENINDNTFYDFHEIGIEACGTGNMEMLEYLHKNGMTFDNSCYYQIYNVENWLEIVEWLKTIECYPDIENLSHAIQWSSNIAYLEYLELNYGLSVLDPDFKIRYAFGWFKLEAMTWMYEKGFVFNDDFINCCLDSENINLLKWLIDRGCKVNNEFLALAMKRNSFDVIKILLEEHKCDINPDYISVMLRSNKNTIKHSSVFYKYTQIKLNELRRNIIKIIYNKINILPNDICFCAVINNDFELLKWAHSLGYGVGPEIFNRVIEENNILILEWLYDNKCPVNENEAFKYASKNIQIIFWLVEKGYKTDTDMTRGFHNDDIGIKLIKQIGLGYKSPKKTEAPFFVTPYTWSPRAFPEN